MKKNLFSGVQPSGNFMLGNYIGAVRNWLGFQDHYSCIFCIVDLHAITVAQDPQQLRDRTLEVAATYLACGVDPSKATIFVQSQVEQHSELAWILMCSSTMGELSRMTQFKDKSSKQKSIGVGLFTYPVLMASDILLYQTQLVPVGEDQKQHLELARDLAIRINSSFESTDGKPLFVVPEGYIPPIGARIMSLSDPSVKMSKSDPDPNATLFLSDSDDLILKKLKRAVTDSGSEVTYGDAKPGVKNLIQIQSALLGMKPELIAQKYIGKQYGHLKIETAEVVIQTMSPIREQLKNLLDDRSELEKILEIGADRARALAEVTMKRVKAAMGFLAVLSLFVYSGCASIASGPEARFVDTPTKGPVGRTFSKNAESFTQCGRDSVSIQTGHSQKIELHFVVSKEGKVQKPRIEHMSSPDPDLYSCVVKVLSKIQFPAPGDQKPKDIRYAISIKPD